MQDNGRKNSRHLAKMTMANNRFDGQTRIVLQQQAEEEAFRERQLSKLRRLEQAIAKEENRITILERAVQTEKYNNDQFLENAKKKCLDEKMRFEEAEKYISDNTPGLEKLQNKVVSMKGEIEDVEEHLRKYRVYKNALSGLCRPEWGTEQTNIADPLDILRVIEKMTTENIFMINATGKVDEKLKSIQTVIGSTRKRMQTAKDKQTVESEDLMGQIQNEKRNIAMIQKAIELDTSQIADLDQVLEALDAKVQKLYRSCTNARNPGSILENLSDVDAHMHDLLKARERFPAPMFRKFKQRMNCQRIQREKDRRETEKVLNRERRKLKVVKAERVMFRSYVEPKVKKVVEKRARANVDANAYVDELYDFETFLHRNDGKKRTPQARKTRNFVIY